MEERYCMISNDVISKCTRKATFHFFINLQMLDIENGVGK